MARYGISLSEEQQDDAEVLATVLTIKFVYGVLEEHGASRDEFNADLKDSTAPVTLGELRDWLGY